MPVRHEHPTPSGYHGAVWRPVSFHALFNLIVGWGTAIREGCEMTWRVLVADDDPEICTLIKTILGKGPYEITLCNDAESALVHLQQEERFDILISDFMLPGISGIELITQIRQNAATSQMPIVMISGHSNYAMDARARAAGANAFLNKPFTLAQLRSTVQQLLSDPLQPAFGV